MSSLTGRLAFYQESQFTVSLMRLCLIMCLVDLQVLLGCRQFSQQQTCGEQVQLKAPWSYYLASIKHVKHSRQSKQQQDHKETKPCKKNPRSISEMQIINIYTKLSRKIGAKLRKKSSSH